MSKFGQLLPLYRRLLGYVKPYRGRLVAGLIFGALYGPTNLAVLAVVQKLWARVFEQTGDELSGWTVGLVAVLLPVVMWARGLCDFLSTYLMNWVGLRAVMDLRVRMFAQLQRLSLDYYTGTRAGELMSRVTNDVGLVQQAISNVIEDIVKEPITLLCVYAGLLYKDWRLTLAASVLFPLCLVPILVFGRRTRMASRAAQQHQASLLSVLHEAITGLRVIKAFSAEDRETEDFRGWCRRVFQQRMKLIRARALSNPMIEVVAGLGGALVFLYAYGLHLKGSLIVTFGVGLFFLYGPVKKISRVHMQIQESLAAAERIFQVLDQQPTVVESPTARVLPQFHEAIRFRDVSFSYDCNGAAGETGGRVLDSIQLEVPAGALVAIVGASGAGKTTLFNLVSRFYDPTGGVITLDGVDLRDLSFQSLRAQLGLVTQETFLFNDTVANNIAYGKPGATREEIVRAAERGHAHEFIMQMPQQYDTVVGDLGVKLSGGQRQRLAIARAVLKSPPILLLDEATSALDTESERVVQAALDDLMWGTAHRALTMLVIAHRLSTVQHADRIIVLDKGHIVEQGTHEELLARGQVYRRLYELQFQA